MSQKMTALLRITVITAIAVATLSLGVAQEKSTKLETFVSESFEGGAIPADWNVLTSGESSTWEVTSEMAYDGSFAVEIENGGEGIAQNEYLITSVLDLSSTTDVFLRFWEKGNNWTESGQLHAVKVSTSVNFHPLAFVSVLEMTPDDHTISDSEWNPVVVDLSEFAGLSTIYVALVYSATGEADEWFLDNIEVYEPVIHDLHAQDIYMFDDKPVARIYNYGTVTSGEFSVHLDMVGWDGAAQRLSTVVVDSVERKEEISVVFEDVDLEDDLQKEFIATAEYETDMNLDNNSHRKILDTFTQVKNTVLIEKGTATWCGWCPYSVTSIDELSITFPNTIYLFEYHGSDSYQNNTVSRLDYYNIDGFPTSVFNGQDVVAGVASPAFPGDWQPTYNLFLPIVDARRNDKTGLDLRLYYVEDSPTIQAEAVITYNGEIYNRDLRLFFGLSESFIDESWPSSGYVLDELNYVARELFPNTNGQVLYDGEEAPEQGMEVKSTVNFSVPSGVVKDNCQLIAFVQDIETKEIYAVDGFWLNETPTHLDHEAPGVVHQFKLRQNYPNPFNPSTTVQIDSDRNIIAQIEIFDVTGQRIKSVAKRLTTGSNGFTWNGDNQMGDQAASGTYFMQVTAGDNVETIKMIKIQ
jgi:thiol-disulfide isomerase/thioredoxin